MAPAGRGSRCWRGRARPPRWPPAGRRPPPPHPARGGRRAWRQTTAMPVRYDARDRIATITLDRPEAMNALDPPMLFGLAEAWERAEDDDEVWVVVVTGAGDQAFCVGADLKVTIPSATAN